MPMKVQGVRFSESAWELVQTEASGEGVSASQFVRDAAIMRAMFLVGFRWRAAGRHISELPGLLMPRIPHEARAEVLRFFNELDEYATEMTRPPTDNAHWIVEADDDDCDSNNSNGVNGGHESASQGDESRS